jgi:glycosyltransferase involved in cell wall biosynthesis
VSARGPDERVPEAPPVSHHASSDPVPPRRSLRPPPLRRLPAPARVESLTIFFPMWNEALYARSTLEAAVEVGEALLGDREIGSFELLVVDDGSTDRTAEIVTAMAQEDGRIRLIRHGRRRGLGGCIKTGFANARGELVLYTDADLPCDLAELAKACRLLRYHDAHIVSAYRHDRTGEGPRRAVYSFVYNWLIRLSFGCHLRDVNFSFKLVRRSIFEQIELESESSFIDAELLVRAHRLGFHTVQFGVDYFPRTRGVSTLSSNSVILAMIGEMLRMRPRLRALAPRRGAR